MLCHQAVNDLYQFLPVGNESDSQILSRHEDLGDSIVRGAAGSLAAFDCQSDAMHATLCIALSDGENHYINIYGDGCFIIAEEDKIHFYEIEYEGNAPHYYWYHYKFDDYDKYLDLVSERKRTITRTTLGSLGEILEVDICEEDFLTPNYLHVINKDIKTLSVASDGITSFEGECHHYLKTVKEVCAHKNFAGDFVKRRILSMLKKNKKQSIDHYDDFSIATIHFGEINGTDDSKD